MKFSEQWLRTMADPALSSDALCEALTMAGLEVEDRSPVAPPFSGVVAGRIVAVQPHPNADRLRVCAVDIGTGEPLSVVCGAPNAAANMTVPCATVGAQLPNGLAIRQAQVRGVASQGMLCSAKELGIAEDASGLLVLDAAIAPGDDVRRALGLDDTLITLKLTPNRADCLSILGVAREVVAITGAPLHAPDSTAAAVTSAAVQGVRIQDFIACPRFASRVIEGVDPTAPTPLWMRSRLERSGLRAISAIVDITNYVMLEIGQPLHAYDRAQLHGDVVVRFAHADEKLLLLNGDTLALDRDILLVADERQPLGLAGIMGGERTGIADSTTDVFLEGAFWHPAVIQGKMRRLGFSSDAGYRFERGVDFGLPPIGVERATQLIVAICGGRPGPLCDEKGALPARVPVRVRTSRVHRLLGIDVGCGSIADAFTRLQFAFVRDGADFAVTPPSYRFDLSIEEDFVEEVARIHGFDAINSSSAAHPAAMLPVCETQRPLSDLKSRLVGRDWQEVVTFSFVDGAVEAVLDPSATPLRVLNPIASQRNVMRRTLLPGLIETLQTNLAHRQTRIRIFESGRVFREARADADAQPRRLGGLAYGDALDPQWGAAARVVDFFDIKGDLEALAAPRRLTTTRASHPALHPGRSASVVIDGENAGWLGELHPRLAQHFGLPKPPIVFELDLEVLQCRPLPVAETVSRQPLVRRDMAVVVDGSVAAQDVLSTLRQAPPEHVAAVDLFDVYQGVGIPEGRKSLAILVLMQDTARTLTDAEIDATLASMVGRLHDRFGATLRT